MIEVQLPAYSKMVLHAIKYPHCAVRGVLLGRSNLIGNKSSAEDAVQKISVVDAIPGFHNSLVTPQLEILLIHLDAYCQEEKLKILGFYFANQQATDTGFDEVLGRMAMDKLNDPIFLQMTMMSFGLRNATSMFNRALSTFLEGLPEVVAYVDHVVIFTRDEDFQLHLDQIENTKLSINSNCSALHAFVNDGKWKSKPCEVLNEEDTITATSIAIQNKLYRNLADFENYLEQPTISDFYNTELNMKIDTIL